LLAGAATFWVGAGSALAQDTTPEVQAVDALNTVFGKHPGFRANHAKGTMLEGSFTASPDAAALTTAAFLQPGVTIPITVRFSDSTGLPDIPDGAPGANPHGMAIRFHQADGTDVDFVINSLKFFPVANVSEFRDLLLSVAASPPGAAHPNKFEQFAAAHPSVLPALGSVATPASLALENYQGVDAFILTNKAGAKHAVRFDVIPDSGVVTHLDPAEAAKLPPDYLMREIVQRVWQGPVQFHLRAQVAAPSDPTKDPTIAWPDSRTQVDCGLITLTRPVADSKEAEKSIVFMPTNLTDGIEPSDDPLIQSRTAAYAESFGRRQQ
jgi:catalase